MTDIKSVLRTELAPTPNRLPRALLIALLCGLVVLASKALYLPETALSAYLIFFVSRENSELSVTIGVGLIFIAFLALALVFALIMLSAGTPILRILIMFTIAFCSMYLAESTSAGVIVATLGMVFFEILSVLDFVPFPDLVLRGLFWVLPMVMIPMGLLIITNLLFGTPAIILLKKEVSHRLELIRHAIIKPEANSFSACREEFLLGTAHMAELRQIALVGGRLTKEASRKVAHIQDVTMSLLARCASGFPPNDTPDNRHALDLDYNSTRLMPQDPLLQELVTETDDKTFAESEMGGYRKDPKETMRFAIKSTIAIGICYAIFILLNWPAIHTITITAFLVCLGTSDETLHKAKLRLTGCLIGAIISFFCLIVIIPNLTNAAELAVLTAIVALPAAWISVGRETSAYIGMQIALVFFLSVLNSPGPDVDLGIAWGRIVGIVLGNLVVAVVFLTLWPRSSVQAIENNLNRAITLLAAIPKHDTGRGVWLGNACDALAKACEAITRVTQNSAPNSSTHERIVYLKQVHSELETIALSAHIFDDARLGRLAQLQNSLSRDFVSDALVPESC